jgi:NTP pyrophosphatase (non-canonical NTP hydrolase)
VSIKQKKLYLCGPMSGIAEYNYPVFHQVASDLKHKGYQITSPARNKPDSTMSWADYLRLGLADVLRVEALALLPGWEASQGAQLEVYLAQSLEMPCRTVANYLDDVDEEVPRRAVGPTTADVKDWKLENFDEESITETTLGLAEETGELCRAVLKRYQGIRGDKEYWSHEIKKEVADVVIKAHDVAAKEGFDLMVAVAERWDDVSRRDWRANPLTG